MNNEDVNLSNVKIVDAEAVFEKRPIENILEESKNIDPQTVADEVIQWLIDNVENYIDNHVRVFKLDLILDNESESVEAMEETKRLQDLYRAIPDDEEVGDVASAVDCRNQLNAITSDAFEIMKRSQDKLQELFKRLSYYYELKGVKEGKMLVQELDGHVDITNFEYEAFSVGVKVYGGFDKVMDGEQVEKGEKKVVKQYTIPEAFTVWIELAFKPKERPLAIF